MIKAKDQKISQPENGNMLKEESKKKRKKGQQH